MSDDDMDEGDGSNGGDGDEGDDSSYGDDGDGDNYGGDGGTYGDGDGGAGNGGDYLIGPGSGDHLLGYAPGTPGAQSAFDPDNPDQYPSIGPLSEDDVQAQKDADEWRHQMLDFLGDSDDPHTHGESEPDEPPEPNMPTLVE